MLRHVDIREHINFPDHTTLGKGTHDFGAHALFIVELITFEGLQCGTANAFETTKAVDIFSPIDFMKRQEKFQWLPIG